MLVYKSESWANGEKPNENKLRFGRFIPVGNLTPRYHLYQLRPCVLSYTKSEAILGRAKIRLKTINIIPVTNDLHGVMTPRVYLHDADVVRPMNFRVFCQLLLQWRDRSFQVLALACELFLYVCVDECRLRLYRTPRQHRAGFIRGTTLSSSLDRNKTHYLIVDLRDTVVNV